MWRKEELQALYGGPEPSFLRSYRYDAEFLSFILSNPQFVLKLHGDINDINTMLLDPDRAWDNGALSGSRGDRLRTTYSSAAGLGHIVFVGAGMRDRTILELHSAWKSSGIERREGLRFVALVPEGELDTIREELQDAETRQVIGRADDFFDEIDFRIIDIEEGGVGVHVRDYLARLADMREHSSSHPSSPPLNEPEERLEDLRRRATEVYGHFMDWTPTPPP